MNGVYSFLGYIQCHVAIKQRNQGRSKHGPPKDKWLVYKLIGMINAYKYMGAAIWSHINQPLNIFTYEHIKSRWTSVEQQDSEESKYIFVINMFLAYINLNDIYIYKWIKVITKLARS